MQGRRVGLVGWLVALVVGQLAAFEVVRQVFVDTVDGQQLDTAALAGNSVGQGQLRPMVLTVLDAVSVLSVVAAVAAIGFIALIRRRVLLAAVTTGMVVCANLTAQLLKAITDRPQLGVDLARAAAGNSLPSGHTTVTASVAVALVLVLPPRARGPAALAGAAATTLVGAATLSAGWHRPSDAVAALLLVGAWAAAAGVVLVLAGRAASAATSADGHPTSALALLLAAGAAAVVATLALVATRAALSAPDAPDPELLSSTQLIVAYVGGAAGIGAAACAVMAAVLVTVHRVVPGRD